MMTVIFYCFKLTVRMAWSEASVTHVMLCLLLSLPCFLRNVLMVCPPPRLNPRLPASQAGTRYV